MKVTAKDVKLVFSFILDFRFSHKLKMHQLYIRAVNGPHNEVTKISFWNSSGHIMGKVVYTTETAKDIDVEELYMLTAQE